jgi:hypothetical protein
MQVVEGKAIGFDSTKADHTVGEDFLRNWAEHFEPSSQQRGKFIPSISTSFLESIPTHFQCQN